MTSARPSLTIDALLEPTLQNPPEGNFLRYTPLYDQIKEARREDDHLLPQEFHDSNFKKADWYLVESLCTDALIQQSKDLQIAAWLGEAWIILDGLEGLKKALDLLTSLCKKYWPILYPKIDNDDLEYRLHILEWISQSYGQRLTQLSLTDVTGIFYTYETWLFASKLEATAKRSPEPIKFLENAAKKQQVILSEFNKQLERTSPSFIQNMVEQLDHVKASFEIFLQAINTICGNDSPRFQSLKTPLEGIQGILKNRLKKAEELSSSEEVISEETLEILSSPEKSSPSSFSCPPITSRSQAYKILAEVAECLDRLEPHSPTPHLLRRIVSWENKSLTEILTTIAQTPQDFALLLKLLGAPSLNSDAKSA
jgi:type VI secretion system ImpA family protein